MRAGSIWYFFAFARSQRIGSLHVMDGRRELVFRGEAITDRHGNVALLCQPNAKAVVSLPSASTETAAVDAGNRRERPVASFGPGHIKLKVLAIRVGVFNVRLEDDVFRDGDVGRSLGVGEFGIQRASADAIRRYFGRVIFRVSCAERGPSQSIAPPGQEPRLVGSVKCRRTNPEFSCPKETRAMSEPLPQEQISRMLTGYWISQALYVAAKLGLADLLKDGPRTAEDLAPATKSHPRALYRLLRGLASMESLPRTTGTAFP